VSSDENVRVDEDIELFQKDEWIDGFNWKTIVGCLFVGLVMMPGAIYLGLVTGQSLAGAAEWVTIILFIEIAKRSFVRLRRQEIIMIYGMAAGMLMIGIRLGCAAQIFGGPLGNVIWDQFFVNSPQAKEFADQLPSWFAPPPGHHSYIQRTFFDRAWAIPLLILAIHMVLSWTQGLAGSYVLYRITNDIERLPFPMSRVHAGGATALAESSSKQETWRWRVFSIGAMIGLMFGLVYVTLPSITGALLPNAIMILPIPFIDFTAQINQVIPAAGLGLATSLGPILAGFVLPFWAVVGGFFGALACWFILNPILYYNGLLPSWQPGMSIIPTSIALRVDYYISQGIGLALVITLMGIVAIWRTGLKTEYEKRDIDFDDLKGRGEFPLWGAGLIWGICLLSYVVLCHLLVPDFPLWIILVFAFVFTPLNSYLTARMIGMTGSGRGAQFPFIREGALLLSGYRGVAIWFAPLPLFNVGSGVDGFKQAELTRTRFISKVKGTVYGLFFLSFFSIFFWSIIWKMAPIPSGSYPYVQRMWPLFAQMQALWVKVLMERGGELTQFQGGDLGNEDAVHTYESLVADYPKSVNAVVEDDRGRMWVGVMNRGMHVFDVKTKRWYHVVPEIFLSREGEGTAAARSLLTIPVKTVYALAYTGEGRLYCGTDDGLWVMNGFGDKGMDWKKIPLKAAVGVGKRAKLRVDKVFLERSGGTVSAVWCAVFGGVCRVALASADFGTAGREVGNVEVTFHPAREIGIGKKIRVLAAGPDGKVYVGTNRGMAVFDGATWRKPEGGGFREVTALLPLRDAVYVGCKDGLYTLRGDEVREVQEFKEKEIYCLRADGGGDVFVGTREGFAVLGRGGKVRCYTEVSTAGREEKSIPVGRVYGIDFLSVRGKAMTFVSTARGVICFEGREPVLCRFLSSAEGLITPSSRRVFTDSSGDVWILSNPMKSMLLKGIRLSYIFWSFVGGLIFYGICVLLRVPLLFFYGACGAAAGAVGAWPHQQIPMFFGALLGRYYFARKFGARRWSNYAPVIMAGFACGMGLIGMSSIGISLIIKAVNTLVY